MFLKYTNRLRYLVLAIFSHLIAPPPLLRNHVTWLLTHQSLSACKDGGYRE